MHLDGVSYDYFKKTMKLGRYISSIKPYPGYSCNEVSLFTGKFLGNHTPFSFFKKGVHRTPSILEKLDIKLICWLNRPHKRNDSFLSMLTRLNYDTKYIPSSRPNKYKYASEILYQYDIIYISEMYYDNGFHKEGIQDIGFPNGFEEFLKQLKDQKIPFALFSNHGMVPVKHYIPPPAAGEKAIFVDSAIVRYWNPIKIPKGKGYDTERIERDVGSVRGRCVGGVGGPRSQKR